MKFQQLDSKTIEILTDLTNEVIKDDYKHVMSDGIKNMRVNNAQVKAMYRASWIYTNVMDKAKKAK